MDAESLRIHTVHRCDCIVGLLRHQRTEKQQDWIVYIRDCQNYASSLDVAREKVGAAARDWNKTIARCHKLIAEIRAL